MKNILLECDPSFRGHMGEDSKEKTVSLLEGHNRSSHERGYGSEYNEGRSSHHEHNQGTHHKEHHGHHSEHRQHHAHGDSVREEECYGGRSEKMGHGGQMHKRKREHHAMGMPVGDVDPGSWNERVMQGGLGRKSQGLQQGPDMGPNSNPYRIIKTPVISGNDPLAPFQGYRKDPRWKGSPNIGLAHDMGLQGPDMGPQPLKRGGRAHRSMDDVGIRSHYEDEKHMSSHKYDNMGERNHQRSRHSVGDTIRHELENDHKKSRRTQYNPEDEKIHAHHLKEEMKNKRMFHQKMDNIGIRNEPENEYRGPRESHGYSHHHVKQHPRHFHEKNPSEKMEREHHNFGERVARGVKDILQAADHAVRQRRTMNFVKNHKEGADKEKLPEKIVREVKTKYDNFRNDSNRSEGRNHEERADHRSGGMIRNEHSKHNDRHHSYHAKDERDYMEKSSREPHHPSRRGRKHYEER